MAILAERNI